MFEFGKRAACFAVAGTLALGGLAGCGAQQQGSSAAASSSAAPEPTTAMEVYERYEANPNHNNVHSDFTYNVELSLMGQAVDFSGTTTCDKVGDASHETNKIQAMGQDTTTEEYVEKTADGKFAHYSSADEDGKTTWTKIISDVSDLDSLFVNKDMFKDAKLEKTDGGYKITVAGKDFSAALTRLGVNNSASMMGGDNALSYAFNNSEAVFTFDKDCLPTDLNYAYSADAGAATSSSSSSSASSSSTTTEEAISVDASAKVDVKMKWTDYGKIDASKVAVPEDVKKNAVDGGEILISDLADAANAAAEETAASSSSSAA
ncbi:MAG: hypothetical protein IKF78_14120 [Atopobiaceae bacterium]|nr:hypothetical protein [Atopobiaceae bacterium]